MSATFLNYSKYYDAIYKDKDYKSEAGYVLEVIRELNPTADQLLELGCGTGNHAQHFCAAGFKVTGIERSAEMVALAKQKNIPHFTPIVSDITSYSLPGSFDIAVSLFHVVSYLTANEALISCFNNTSRHLRQGGIFLFDLWYSPAVHADPPHTRIKRFSLDEFDVTRIAEPVVHHNRNVVDVHYEIIVRDKDSHLSEVLRETHEMRHFSIPEMELLAYSSGFRLIRAEEFLTKKQPGTDTWGVCLILQKL